VLAQFGDYLSPDRICDKSLVHRGDCSACHDPWAVENAIMLQRSNQGFVAAIRVHHAASDTDSARPLSLEAELIVVER
jgi:hypothetical protein